MEGLPDDLQAKLDDYNRNFEALAGILGDSSLIDSGAQKELQVEKTKEMLANALPIAVRSMIGLAGNAMSESVKFKAAQFLIAVSLGKDPAIKAEDPAMELIARLQAPLSEEES